MPASSRLRSRAAALFLALLLLPGSASVVLADDVSNNVDATIDAELETLSLTVGGANGAVGLYVSPTNGDGKNGCNLTGSTTLVVGINSSNTAIATASPASITFASCGDAPTITVHPVAAGSATVSLTLTSNNTSGTFNLAPASFTVNVVPPPPPPNTPPVLHLPSSITAEATSPSGALVTYSATATDAEDDPDPTPTCSPGSGSSFQIGSTNVECSVTDSGGLSASASFTVTVADQTDPVVSIGTAAPLAASGWYNASSGSGGIVVAVSTSDAVGPVGGLACTDNLIPIGGLGPSSGSFTLGDGTHDVACSAHDGAGNLGSASATFKVDQTAPTITPAVSPAANADGWNNIPVTVSYTCADQGSSGLDSATPCPDPDVVSTNGETTLNQSVSDTAGNIGSAALTVRFDDQAPTITGSRTPPANAHGWNNSDVTVHFDCSDATSGVKSCGPDTVLSDEGVGQAVTGDALDYAGNANSATVSGINIDKTAPLISFARTPANASGWNNTNVVVTFSCSDGLSGVDILTPPVTLSSEGAGQSVPGTCIDKAGNSASLTVSDISIDKTAPAMSFARTPSNANGWNNTDVVVTFSCSDALSGVDAVTAPATLGGEGAGQWATGTCTDLAGNGSSLTASDINIDKTAPVITFVSRTPANGFGWNKGDVQLVWACADPLSGPVDPTIAQVVSTEGAGQSASATCYDLAGNSAGDIQGGINIDRTSPSIVIGSPAGGAILLLGQHVPSSYACSDGLSGIDSCVGPVASGAELDTATVGAKSFLVSAADLAGNTTVMNNAYNVQYAPAGTVCLGSPGHAVLQPVNPDGSSVFKQGSTVPVKLRVCDANGVSIGTPGTVIGAPILVGKSTGAGGVDETVISTTPDTAFRWDPTAQQWIFNQSTKNLVSGTKYTYSINVNDGTSIPYVFGVR